MGSTQHGFNFATWWQYGGLKHLYETFVLRIRFSNGSQFSAKNPQLLKPLKPLAVIVQLTQTNIERNKWSKLDR